ncbi:MAG: thiamine diphosphokinase [Chloroflexi bacterium]|nr:MAG: thiamine diphosphokinase [Chloroflexota bacterium]
MSVPATGRPAVVFAAAPLAATARLKSRLAQLEHPFVVAADGGAKTALAFGLRPDVVIGDLDSLDPATLREHERTSVQLETYPRDKDATDGQLAVERALAADPSQLILLGFLGGPRLDQALANVLVLRRVEIPAVLLDESNECILLRGGGAHPRPAMGARWRSTRAGRHAGCEQRCHRRRSWRGDRARAAARHTPLSRLTSGL